MKNIVVQVQLYGAAQMNLGWKKQNVILPASTTIAELLQVLSQNEGTNQLLLEGEEHSLSSLIMLNSVDIKKREGLKTKLMDGDVVIIVSVISGG